jgi:hypothetical protein
MGGSVMVSTALQRFNWRKLQFARSEILRMVAAGATWKLALSAGLAGKTMWNHGVICLADIVAKPITSIVAGILAIDPIAAYGRR